MERPAEHTTRKAARRCLASAPLAGGRAPDDGGAGSDVGKARTPSERVEVEVDGALRRIRVEPGLGVQVHVVNVAERAEDRRRNAGPLHLEPVPAPARAR